MLFLVTALRFQHKTRLIFFLRLIFLSLDNNFSDAISYDPLSIIIGKKCMEFVAFPKIPIMRQPNAEFSNSVHECPSVGTVCGCQRRHHVIVLNFTDLIYL